MNHSIREPRGVMYRYFNCTPPALISKYIQMNPVAYYQIIYIWLYIHCERLVRAKCILTELHWICFQKESIIWLFPNKPSHPCATSFPSQYKDGLSRYEDSHYKDKTVLRPPHLCNRNPNTGYNDTRQQFYIETAPGIMNNSNILLQGFIQNIFKLLQLSCTKESH